MREIKFRAWDKKRKMMIDLARSDELWGIMARVNNYSGEFYTTIWKFQDEDCWPDKRIALFPDDIELMQYTGLYDKNGKTIYEGDIIRCWENTTDHYEEHIGFVEWYDCGLKINLKDGFKFVSVSGANEVIGNIWENSSLLENKQ